MAAESDPGTKYDLSARERSWLRSDIVATEHATHQHRKRAPQDAVAIGPALERVVIDEAIPEHPFFAGRPEDNTSAVAVYRGRTRGGTTYGMVYPLADTRDRGILATTAYRVRSVTEHAQETAGLSEEVGVALRVYLKTLGDQGGVVRE